jgi:spore germination protein YaaH
MQGPVMPLQACASTYTVQSGDSLSAIAQTKGTTLSDLERANPSITDPNQIQVGLLTASPSANILPHSAHGQEASMLRTPH